jgi:galactose mutarotase-like enzyme
MASNQPGAQIYSGHHWRQKPVTGRGGVRYGNAAGLAIETQAFPNAPNEAGFPNAILRTGKKYRNEIEVELVALAPSKVEGFLAEPWSSTARLAQKDVP